MRGQWIGQMEGSNSGLVILDLDDEGSHYEGHVFAFDEGEKLPGIVARIVTSDCAPSQSITTTDIAFIRPNTTQIVDRQLLLVENPELRLPVSITIDFNLDADGLTASWSSDVGTEGAITMPSCRSSEDSDLKVLDDVNDWRSFREYALSLPHRQHIFRGQDVCKRLRTSFHRTRRKDLIRYITEDVSQALRALSSRTRHLFDVNFPDQNAAFLNLLQHHGYPTPLLDWSYSPFVAAFFAYRSRRPREDGDMNVRIFIFDRQQWMKDWLQLQSITFARPHFSMLEALSIENHRALPQQALLSATNVDDIESYIRGKESESGNTYLTAVDLPFAERRKVMEDLSTMGITAGSMFPGLDGACEELRGRLFHPLD